ncbi:transcriptional regulator, TetR family [Lentzea xinjiangensis]|uniref:Transcriptional regulator, TetR family n=1 Tax=Lentzea xinjiangensis TaxID=402600 RepID=A0A1H9V5H9_9PSEU|nr:TetR/AcrR family transcriptional regulator [Lentzea xinjiangensis]SES16654.1 transcriptional regulator, TetR family [Lentzea xinjiangensis]
MSRAPRKDGIANREKILVAALRTLQRDITAPMAVVAQEAEVGIGTLYRHFRDRNALLDALQVRSIGMVLVLVEDILARELSGLDAVREFLVRTVRHGAELFLPYHGAPKTSDPEYRRLDESVWDRVREMVERGIADKTLRADLRAHDVIVFGSLIAVPLPGVADWPVVAGRQIDLFLTAARRSP